MQKTIFHLTIGAFVAVLAVLGVFHLSYMLLYPNYRPEDVSLLIEAVIVVIAIVLSVLKAYRFFGIGMIAGCLL
jgi:hypothetical protein